MPRPVIGICAAVEQARFGPWEQQAVLIPRSYPDAVHRAGGMALIFGPDPATTRSPDELLDRLDALVLAGGVDLDADPDRDGFEFALARRALQRRLPLLGVCRGMQTLNAALGGTLERHLPDRLGSARHRPTQGRFAEHEIRLEPGSLAARAAGAERLTVQTHHHQGVARLGEGLKASGWSVEDDVVESIELDEADPERFVLGVLWHPEEDAQDGVIPALVNEAS